MAKTDWASYSDQRLRDAFVSAEPYWRDPYRYAAPCAAAFFDDAAQWEAHLQEYDTIRGGAAGNPWRSGSRESFAEKCTNAVNMKLLQSTDALTLADLRSPTLRARLIAIGVYKE